MLDTRCFVHVFFRYLYLFSSFRKLNCILLNIHFTIRHPIFSTESHYEYSVMSPFVIIIKCVRSQNKIKLSFLLFFSNVTKSNDTNGCNYLQPQINFSGGNGLNEIDSPTQ